MISTTFQKLLSKLGADRRPDMLNLAAVGTALLIAGAPLTLFEFWALKSSLQADLQVQARIIGDNAQAALAFQDAKAATEILSALRGSPTVISAVIYDIKDRSFASYTRAAESLPANVRDRTTSGWFLDRMEVSHAIAYSEGQLGTVRLTGSLSQVYSNLAGFVGATVLTASLR